MASLYFESVTLPPLGATNTTGTVPLERDGNLSASTSVACWLSVPGSVRLSLRLSPTLRSTTWKPTKAATQIATTTQP